MHELRILVGLPASGKSTFAEEKRKEGYAVFSSDEMREKEGYTDNNLLFGELHRRIREGLKTGNCIFDATNLSRKNRMALIRQVENYADCVCDLFLVPVNVCRERNKSRGNNHGVTDFVIDRMLKSFSCPWYSEGFSDIVIHAEKGLLGYSDEDKMTFTQDNPHHTLTLGEHEQKAVEYIQENCMLTENFPFLLEAARYHDDGKLFTKTFTDAKGRPTNPPIAHFYRHENVGSYLFLVRGFCARQYDRAGEYPLTDWGILYTSILIGLHMRPVTAWKKSEKATERDRIIYGQELFNDVLAVSEADIQAK